MSSDLKKIKIDNINLGSNFEVASYRTQRNSGGIAPLRGNGNIIATNNFAIDDEVVLNFKVNKKDLINFIKIYARFKTKGMLLIESPILAYKLIHGDMENNYSFNAEFIKGSLVTEETAQRIVSSILTEKYFFAMLSEFNIKSLNDTSGGFEIEMVLQTWSDLINDEVVEIYKKLTTTKYHKSTFDKIDGQITSLVEKPQNMNLKFTVTSEEISTSTDFGNEYVKNTTNEAMARLEKIENNKKAQLSEAQKNEQKKIEMKDLLKTKLRKTMSWLHYQISEFEVRMKNNIATIPIQGKPKPFKQHLGLGECYITVKIIMDENNAKDKQKIKEIKRLTSIKQNDIFTEIEFGIANAFDLKSVTVANVFFTNDDESDSVIMSIVFAANAYSRKDLSIYNEVKATEATSNNDKTYRAFNGWMNIIFRNPKEFESYVVDVNGDKDSKMTLLKLAEIYNDNTWQSWFNSQRGKSQYDTNFIKNYNGSSNDGLAGGRAEDLVCITQVTNILDTYSFLLIKNNGCEAVAPIANFQEMFKLNKNNQIEKGSVLDVYTNKMLAYSVANMVTQSSDQYQNKDGLNAFNIVMVIFYKDFQNKLEKMYKTNKQYIDKAKTIKALSGDIGENIDLWLNGMLKNLGKSKNFTNYTTIKDNDILGMLKVLLKSETLENEIFAAIKNQDSNNKGESESSIAATKMNIQSAINNMNKNLDIFMSDPTIIKALCKTIVKLKTFRYYSWGKESLGSETIGTLIISHIMTTVLMIPFMIDIYGVTSTYGHFAMRSAEYIMQYYKILYKATNVKVKTKAESLKQANLLVILTNIFGAKNLHLLNSSINEKKEFVEKKDYQKYLDTQIENANISFKIFFNVIMNTQAHKTKQEFFQQHLANLNKISGNVEAVLSKNNMVVNPADYSDAHREMCGDRDPEKEKIIKSFLSDSNIIYQDMFASDLDSTGLIYSFNKLLGGNNINNWFKKNNIGIRQAASLKYIYKKYENLQKIFNYEYNKILPDYKITIIQESVTNGVVCKRRYVNLNEYVGLDKVINISIEFNKETRMKTAVIQLIDSTNLLSTMSQEIVVKSAYRDILQNIDKERITYNDEYYSPYPAIKPGQLIKIEMGYVYEAELNVEFTGVIASVNTGRVTTLICNNFVADLANGDVSVQRYGASEIDDFGDLVRNWKFLKIPTLISDYYGDANDKSAAVKANYNPEFINSNSEKPYADACEKASNFNILAEAIRKQPDNLRHLNNPLLDEVKSFGALSDELNYKKNIVEKIIQPLYSTQTITSRIYDNVNNVDQDEEIYGNILITQPANGAMIEYKQYKICEIPELRKIITNLKKEKLDFKKICSESLKSTIKHLIFPVSAFTDSTKELNSTISNTSDTPVIIRTGSPFCKNNFKSVIYNVEREGKTEQTKNISNTMNADESHQASSFESSFSKKHTNLLDILNIVEKRLPGVFFNVLEYGDFGTLFVGRENYNIRTEKETNKLTYEDINLVLAQNFLDLGNSKLITNYAIHTCSHINAIEALAACAVPELAGKFDQVTQEKITKMKVANTNFMIKTAGNDTSYTKEIKPYKNIHTIVSGKNLISCNIQINANYYNSVFCDYKLSIQDLFNELVNLRFGGITLKLYNGLSKDKSRIKKIDHKELCVYTRDQALSVAQSCLIEEVENIYYGEVVALYMPNIKYRDEIVIQNYEDKIFGTFVVKEFKHIFNQDGAFTIITPMLKVQMNSLSNELLHDSIYSQFIFLNPEFKSGKTAPVSDVDKMLKNMIANDALHKPLYFDGYAYEYQQKGDNESGFVDNEIVMNTKLPLKIFPLIQKDVFMFPDMEDYGKQQPTFIANLVNGFGIKVKQINYFLQDYNWWKQIGLLSSQAVYNLTAGIRNWNNESGEVLKYESPDNVFIGDPYKEAINNMTNIGAYVGTTADTLNANSRIIPPSENVITDYSFLWFNTKDTIAGTKVVKNSKGQYVDQTLSFKGGNVSSLKQGEKIVILGDLASQFDIISFVEIYAKNITEANNYASAIVERANLTSTTKTFKVASIALLCSKTYSEVKNSNGVWVQKEKISEVDSMYIKPSYNRILKKQTQENPFDVVSLSTLKKLRGKQPEDLNLNVDDTKDDYNEYGVVIYNTNNFDVHITEDTTKLNGVLTAWQKRQIFIEGFTKETLWKNENHGNCILFANYGESGGERIRRNAAITMFKPKIENKKTKDNLIAVVTFHNFYGSSKDIAKNLNKRKLCAQHMFDSVQACFPTNESVKPIIFGDFNLDITKEGGTNVEGEEKYYLGHSGYLQKSHSVTTTGGKRYDKAFVDEVYKNITTEAFVYSEYLLPTTNTRLNTQSAVSDHYPLVMYLTREDVK